MRARWVKPEFFNDKKIGKLGPIPALVFQALWCMADDGGTAPATPEIIKGQMFMYWTAVGLPEIAEALRLLCDAKRITCYTVGDDEYATIVNWSKHQAVHNPSKFRYPQQCQVVTENTEAVLRQEGGSPHLLDSQNPRLPESQTPEATPRVVLPQDAEKFLATFYEPALTDATRKRYREVKQQLYETLDPLHAGPKIRGGIRVKARSVEHLAEELRAVMKEPPIDRDMAIVFVLKRLTNPPKGPSVTEVAKRQETQKIQLQEQYQAASHRAGATWAKNNPGEFAKIEAAVNATYRGKTGDYVDVARKAELVQRTSKACGFPSFETWLANRQQNGATAA